MPLTLFNQLLHLLADGEFHSGSELGECLHVSRAAVWKQLQGVEALGITLHRIRGKGYRIPNGLDLLDVQAILRFQPKLKNTFNLQLVMSTESTNRMLMQQLVQQSVHGSVVLAEVQTAGRGRLGRHWHSPFAQQLAFSVGWQFPNIKNLEGLSLLVGLSVIKTLVGMGVEGLALKWPNDILLHGNKLAGILVELQAESTGVCQVVIGVGINVHMLNHQDIDQPWTSLRAHGYVLSRSQLLAELLCGLQEHLDTHIHHGFSYYYKQWQLYHGFQNKMIAFSQEGTQLLGECQGVDKHGALLVKVDGQLITINAGDVSIRLAET